MLRARRTECGAIDSLLADVRAGGSRALVVTGEAGVGKSALLDYGADAASGFRVSRATGVESESELPYAAVQQLCGSMVDRLDELPVPQGKALGVAFGLGFGDAPDRFLVGLAVLTLLANVAEQQPLLCVIDDAQWLDRESVQTLVFVARRLGRESIGLLLGVRTCTGADDFSGLPELFVHGLPDADARALLESVIPGRLDDRVRDRIVAETRGNPLALLELPHGLSPPDLAGGFGVVTSTSLAHRIEEGFRRRHESLPPQTRLLLLLAAAEPLGDPMLLWRAATSLGIGVDDSAAAEADGLFQLGDRVIFRHPLVRSAIYRGATMADRQRVHRALADATDESDPDRRAWHRAHGSRRPDEHDAAELERSAGRALSRGGFPAAAAFLERAAMLTPDPSRRATRTLTAASFMHQAGAPDDALKLLTVAEQGPLDELHGAQLERLRGQIWFAVRRGSDAPPLLLHAAKRLQALDANLARETYLEALIAAIFAGRLNSGSDVREAAVAARAAPPAARPPRAIDLLLEGLIVRFADSYQAAVAPLQEALRAFCRVGGRDAGDLRWFGLACRIAPDLWDDDLWLELADRHVLLARETGALAVLAIAVTYRAGVHVHAGEFTAASALNDEADALTRAVGSAPLRYTSPILAAWRGDEPDTSKLVDTSVADATTRGEGRAITIADYATAVLCNGLGRYDEALAAAKRACKHDNLGLFGWGLIELIEAAARSGDQRLAATALERLSERTRPSRTEWAAGIEARSRALLTDGRSADDLYLEAIDRLERCRIVVHLARAHLVYGEWLRREGRRLAAREQLRTAYEMLTSMGASAFAARAERELRATGEHARKRTVDTQIQLTGQEEQIAQLASTGSSNAEIAAQLFISPRTVEYHLHKVFTKVGIRSRNQLATALARRSG
jgi:DNA-binding CsgD family transcriptional regulator